jgi:hypothetical protein
MPLQNHVTPLGGLVADPARGLVYGTRGCLHDESRRIRRRDARGERQRIGNPARVCGKKERIPVSVPDVRSRVAAIELVRKGLGRVEEATGWPSTSMRTISPGSPCAPTPKRPTLSS